MWLLLSSFCQWNQPTPSGAELEVEQNNPLAVVTALGLCTAPWVTICISEALIKLCGSGFGFIYQLHMQHKANRAWLPRGLHMFLYYK